MERIILDNVSKKFWIGVKKNQNSLQQIISLISGREPKKNFFALKEVSFSVHEKEIVGIIGKNGSGKSTLMRIISKIYKKFLISIITGSPTYSILSSEIIAGPVVSTKQYPVPAFHDCR